MRKSQEDEDIEKIFQKSRMTTEAPIVKQEVDQEKPKELENTMYRSAKGWIETLCSAAETAGHISSELLTTVGTQKNQRRESEAARPTCRVWVWEEESSAVVVVWLEQPLSSKAQQSRTVRNFFFMGICGLLFLQLADGGFLLGYCDLQVSVAAAQPVNE